MRPAPVAARHVRLSSRDHLGRCVCSRWMAGGGPRGWLPSPSTAGICRWISRSTSVSRHFIFADGGKHVLRRALAQAGAAGQGGRGGPWPGCSVREGDRSVSRPGPRASHARHLVAFDRVDGPGGRKTTGFIAELIGQWHHATYICMTAAGAGNSTVVDPLFWTLEGHRNFAHQENDRTISSTWTDVCYLYRFYLELKHET